MESGCERKLLPAVRNRRPKAGTSDVAVGQLGGKRFLAATAYLDEDGNPEIACIGQATHNLVLWHVGP